IVFFAALALGRFSITALGDYAGPATETGEGVGVAGGGAGGDGVQAGQDTTTPQAFGGSQHYGSQCPSGTDPSQTGQYQAGAQYPQTTEQYPQAAGQYPAPDPAHGPFGLTQEWPTPGLGSRSQSPFSSAQYPSYPGGPNQATTPEPTTAIE